MSDRNQNSDSNPATSPDNLTNRGNGMQGIDKAPGEETPTSTDNPVYTTQKGKNKVDGDPSVAADQPARE
jgi:hypothetical protein